MCAFGSRSRGRRSLCGSERQSDSQTDGDRVTERDGVNEQAGAIGALRRRWLGRTADDGSVSCWVSHALRCFGLICFAAAAERHPAHLCTNSTVYGWSRGTRRNPDVEGGFEARGSGPGSGSSGVRGSSTNPSQNCQLAGGDVDRSSWWWRSQRCVCLCGSHDLYVAPPPRQRPVRPPVRPQPPLCPPARNTLPRPPRAHAPLVKRMAYNLYRQYDGTHAKART